MFNNLPTDVLDGIINGYVQDLIDLDRKKIVLSNIAQEACEELADRLNQIARWEDEGLYYAKEYMEIGEDEKKHGPSGDYGDYVCQNYEAAVKSYKMACVGWNDFVKEYADVAHLITFVDMKPIQVDI
jgi:hypothetical protein